MIISPPPQQRSGFTRPETTPLQIQRWDVWHTYATYCDLRAPLRGDVAAERLVASGIAELVFVPPGLTWYRAGTSTKTANLEIDKTPFEAKAKFTLPSSLSPYAGESAYQASFMLTQEQHLVSDPRGILPDYLRVFLPPCQLLTEGYGYAIYPQVKIYGNGVMLTHLRVLSGEKAIPLDEFIARHVNLYQQVGVDLRVPRPVFSQYVRAMLLRHSQTFRQRVTAAQTYDDIRAELDRLGEVEEEELGAWPLVSTAGFPFLDAGPNMVPLTLRHIARMVETAVLEVVGAPRYGPLYLPLGSGQREIALGSYWTGRPSVHLIEYEGQPENTSGLTDSTRRDLAQIMMRSNVPVTMKEPDAILGASTRAYDDFVVYQERGMTLWVSTKADLAPGRGFPEDPNLNYIVLARQVQVEVVDFLHMAARRIHERALEPGGSLAGVAGDEHELLVLEQGIGEVSAMGEIQDLIRQGDACLGLETIRQRTRDAMRLKATEIQERRNTLASRFGLLLTVLFGLMGAPSVQQGITDPLGRLLHLAPAANSDVQSLLSFGAACGCVLLFLLLGYLALRRVTRWSP